MQHQNVNYKRKLESNTVCRCNATFDLPVLFEANAWNQKHHHVPLCAEKRR